MKIDRRTMWMAISGATGFMLFFFLHYQEVFGQVVLFDHIVQTFSDIFGKSSIATGIVQICANIFVFITWGNAYDARKGFRKFVASFGIVIPCMMATITTMRVIYPQVMMWVS